MYTRISKANWAAIVAFIVWAGVNGRAHAQQQSIDQIHLYFFTNTGCAPCLQVEPGIEQLKREGYPVTTIHLSQQPEMARRFQVDRTPTVIMVARNQIVGRHAGLIAVSTLKQWFTTVGKGQNQSVTPSTLNGAIPNSQPQAYSSSTMHQGTRRPASGAEQLALSATVRLKVEDPEGTSYATGTVIHSQAGESLVLTCGHVFRESQGNGRVSAEYGLGDGPVKSAPGRLVYYDSDARDIGLVVIKTEYRIKPVPVASRKTSVGRGNDIFSLGCDHGEMPTIRRSKIKNRAAYDGSIKYDIYGRPVDGRSGGGLFNSNGELIGVCNAAVVDVDEGIYTSLETVYWQLAQVNLQHLFEGPAGTMLANTGPVEMPVAGASSQTFVQDRTGRPPFARSSPSRSAMQERVSQARGRSGFSEVRTSPDAFPVTQNVSWDQGSQSGNDQKEVIIIVRSRNNPSQSETMTINDPTPELLEYLHRTNVAMSRPRELNVAALKTITKSRRR